MQIELKSILIFFNACIAKKKYIFDGGMGQTLIAKGMISK